jgi:hypothetical protein
MCSLPVSLDQTEENVGVDPLNQLMDGGVSSGEVYVSCWGKNNPFVPGSRLLQFMLGSEDALAHGWSSSGPLSAMQRQILDYETSVTESAFSMHG